MPKREAEHDDIACINCGGVLSRWDSSLGCHDPSPEELLGPGHIPVPNLGWFCDEACAKRFEGRSGIKLHRDAKGRIRYY